MLHADEVTMNDGCCMYFLYSPIHSIVLLDFTYKAQGKDESIKYFETTLVEHYIKCGTVLIPGACVTVQAMRPPSLSRTSIKALKQMNLALFRMRKKATEGWWVGRRMEETRSVRREGADDTGLCRPG